MENDDGSGVGGRLGERIRNAGSGERARANLVDGGSGNDGGANLALPSFRISRDPALLQNASDGGNNGRRKKDKKVWKQKTVTAVNRGVKDNELVATALRDMEAQVKGSLDALKELRLEKKEKESEEKKLDDPPPVIHLSEGETQELQRRFGFTIGGVEKRYERFVFPLILFILTFGMKYVLRGRVHLPPNLVPEDWYPIVDLLFIMVCWMLISKMLACLVTWCLPTGWNVFETIEERYSFHGKYDHSVDKDLRPDVFALGDKKHNDPLCFVIKCEVRDQKTRKMITTYRIISGELLSQVVNSKNCSLTCTDRTVFTKLTQAVSTCHSINLSRYISVKDVQIVQNNTAIIAFAMHRKQLEDMRGDRKSVV